MVRDANTFSALGHLALGHLVLGPLHLDTLCWDTNSEIFIRTLASAYLNVLFFSLFERPDYLIKMLGAYTKSTRCEH